ncbi:hypothetical protein B0H11DRAFT_1989481, partial [Mycena galericulata]
TIPPLSNHCQRLCASVDQRARIHADAPIALTRRLVSTYKHGSSGIDGCSPRLKRTTSSIRLINESDPPRCSIPALLGPPKQSACFSICDRRLEVDSTAALRYFVHPPADANLRADLQKFLKLPRKDRVFQRVVRLEDVFTTCLCSENSEETMSGEKLDLNVSSYRGVLYLEEKSILSRIGPDSGSTYTYMGHKFEMLFSTLNPGGEPHNTRVDMHTLWNAAITRKLGSLNILLVGEVDCVKVGYRESPGPEQYMELKTRNLEHGHNISKKRSKWYIQSYLLGTSKIFVGFRDAAGIVRQVKTFYVRDSDMVPSQHKIDWGARVLHSLRDHCARSAEEITPGNALKVWWAQSRPGYVNIRELGAGEVKKLNKGGVPRNEIIPLSFIERLEKRMSTS